MSEVAEMNITEAIENKIDRSNWVKWKFSDLVENIVEKVVPKDSGLEHYIGLEHLDTESLKIRRFGETSTLIGDKLKIYKGDLIFAKRNAYLKRVAIAEFDAVASAHSMVLRPKSKNVNPDFLPFFLMSEVFWKRAIEISVGSLSPTINWKGLAKQEFLLPPKDQQAQLAELLWAMDEVVEREREVLEMTSLARKSYEDYMLFGKFLTSKFKSTKIGEFPESWKLEELQNIAWFQEGPGLRKWQFKDDGIKVINVTNLVNGFLELSNTTRHISWEEFNSTYKHFECEVGDIVIASSGNSYCKHAVIREQDLPLVMNTSVIRFQPLKGIDYDFLNQLLKSRLFKSQIDILITGGAQPNFGPMHLKQVVFPVPSEIETQKMIGSKLTRLDQEISNIETKIQSSQSLQKSLINQIF